MRSPRTSAHRRIGIRLTRTMLATALLTLALPLSAHAQIGSFAKKIARKAANEAAAKAEAVSGVNSAAPTFDEQLLELNESRATAMIAGLTAARAVSAPGGANRAQLTARAGSLNEERNALLALHEADDQRWQAEERRVTSCRSIVIDSLDQAHREAMEKKAASLARSADPMSSKMVQDVIQASQEIHRLMAAGDTAGALQVQRTLGKKHGIDPAADSAHATTRCGHVPKTPAWKNEADSLLAGAQAALRLAQSLDEEAANAGARAAGMSVRQYAIARERIEAYVTANGTPSASWRYSMAERKALLPRISQLKPLL